MCCSFSWHNKQSVYACWDMARLAKFSAFQKCALILEKDMKKYFATEQGNILG